MILLIIQFKVPLSGFIPMVYNHFGGGVVGMLFSGIDSSTDLDDRFLFPLSEPPWMENSTYIVRITSFFLS